MKTNPNFRPSTLSLAVATALLLSSTASAQVANNSDKEEKKDPDFFPIEAISVVGRLHTSASEALEERREQIAVADIMGASQIARTGDSSAASALRRITGLTLKDGKFIYVRGLGERYSSTSLNGAIVPSPDPTRNVVPLDMFPASIIESLSVQKSATAQMPAAFGGGHVDIRTKSTAPQPFAKLTIASSFNTNNSDDALSYNGATNWQGSDDGVRALPTKIEQVINQYGGISPIDIVTGSQGTVDFNSAKVLNRSLALDMHRDMSLTTKSTKPGISSNIALGNSWDVGDESEFGLVGAVSYKQVEKNFRKTDIELDGDESQAQVENDKRYQGTDSKVQVSGMLNMSFELNDNHKVESFSTYLSDTSDKASVAIEETIDTLGEPNALQVYDINFQQRTLTSNQLKGEHFLEDWWDVELRWQYTQARSARRAPSETSYTYNVLLNDNDEILSRRLNTQDAPKYVFSQLDDDTTNYGVKLTLPLTVDDVFVKLNGGYQYFERTRTSYATRLGFDIGLSPSDPQGDILGQEFSQILSDANLSGNVLDFELKDASTDTEDYIAAELNDAAFMSVDLDFQDVWRFYAGVRYEDFRRVTLPLDPQGDISDEGGRYALTDYVVSEDGFFPSMSLTWKDSDDTQWRVAVSKTIVRPDLREVSPVRFQDPVTGFDFFGNPELESSDIINVDARWEWYSEKGNNVSIGTFYKDIEAPIEPIQRISEAGRQLKFYNADSGKIYGVETEFLQTLDFLGDDGSLWEKFFVSANLTLSDSEINIAPSGEIDPTNTTRRMTGHSAWVTNVQLSFDTDDDKHSATIVYNVFGERIAYGGRGGLDDVYEQPFHSLDFSYNFFPTEQLSLKFKAKNLLGELSQYEQQGQRVYDYDPGSQFDLQLSYKF